MWRRPGGVEHDHVVSAQAAGFDGAARDLGGRLVGDDGQRVHADLFAQHTELLLSGGTAHVEGGHQHAALFALDQALGDLGGGGGFARALKTDEHDHDGSGRVEVEGLGVGAEDGHKFVMDDLDDHLSGRDRTQHLLAHGLAAHAVGEGAHDFEGHVGFEQRPAHLAHGGRDVAFGQRAAAG